jgi:gluconokinase
VHHRDLIARVKEGATDEEILSWCFKNGRELNEGDLFVWNSFISKLGWRDRIAPRLEKLKQEFGIAHREDIQCMPDLMDFDEERLR